MTTWVVGVDVGGSGSRLSFVPLLHGAPDTSAARRGAGPRLAMTGDGSDAARVAVDLVVAGLAEHAIGATDVRAVAAGIAGIESLVSDPSSIASELRALLPNSEVVLCPDVVTAHFGALDGAGGVLAAGTGSIALGTDRDTQWKRADGWGHLIGDLGSGAWIGLHALQAGAAAADGRAPSGAALYSAISSVLGPIDEWPRAIYPRPDRAGALAEFATMVQDVADDGDAAARSILERAAGHLADTLLAIFDERVPPCGALSGGLFSGSGRLAALVADAVARRRPEIEMLPAIGTPLDGAIRLAAMAADGKVPSAGPFYR